MTVRASAVTFSYLLLEEADASRFLHDRSNIVKLFIADMIKFQDDRICFPAVHARMSEEKFPDKVPGFLLYLLASFSNLRVDFLPVFLIVHGSARFTPRLQAIFFFAFTEGAERQELLTPETVLTFHILLVSQVRVELTTLALKVRCSSVELLALEITVQDLFSHYNSPPLLL